MTRKISVLGRGTAGCLSAMHFNKYWPDEVQWIYDPNIPTQTVGEGSQLSYPKNLYDYIGFTFTDLDKVDGTLKKGIRKIGYAGSGDFYHNFVPPSVGMHFNAVKMQDYVLEKLQSHKIEIIEKNIEDFDSVDSDFIIDCRGKPKSFDEFSTDYYIPVNAVHVTQCFWDAPKFEYTYTIARPYGWVFGIPLNNRCSIGYLYNSNLNNLDEIKEDVKQVFQDLDLIPSDVTNSFSFSNYSKKENFTDRVAYNGNASFFLEPLEATSIHTMDFINRSAYDVFTGNIEPWVANVSYNNWLNETQQIIMLHYFAHNKDKKFDTEFWNHARMLSEVCLGATPNDRLYDFLDSAFNNRLQSNDFGSGWNNHSFKENISGFEILQELLHKRK